MAIPTLAEQIEETEARLVLYIAAERTVTVGGQSYSIGNRSLTRADLKEINRMIVVLNSNLRVLRSGNQIKMQRVVPSDC